MGQRRRFAQVSSVTAVLLAAALLPGCGRDGPPEVLLMTCDTEGTHVLTPTVATRADGVHVHVLESGGFDAVTMWGGDDNPVRTTHFTTGHTFDHRFIRPLTPGRWSIACFSGSQSSPGIRRQGGAGSVLVVDSAGFFVPYGLSCRPDDRTGFPVPLLAPASSVDSLVRDQLDGVLDSDTVEPAGYPESGSLIWRIVRDGEVVGSLHARITGGTGSIYSVFVCADSAISLP